MRWAALCHLRFTKGAETLLLAQRLRLGRGPRGSPGCLLRSNDHWSDLVYLRDRSRAGSLISPLATRCSCQEDQGAQVHREAALAERL